MSRPPLRVGLIGYGYAGKTFHAPLISAVPDLALVAVADGVSIEQVREVCGFAFELAEPVGTLEPVTLDEVAALRRWDPRGFFLRG